MWVCVQLRMVLFFALVPLLANVADSGTAEPDPEPEPGSGSGSGSGSGNDDGITTTGIVMLTLGSLSVVLVLLYAFWPSIKRMWTSRQTPILSQLPPQATARASQDAL